MLYARYRLAQYSITTKPDSARSPRTSDPTERDIPMLKNQSRFTIAGPLFSLAVFAITVVAVLAMTHFR